MTTFRERSEIMAELAALQIQRQELDQQIGTLHEELAAERTRTRSEAGIDGIGIIGQWLSTVPAFEDRSAGLKERRWVNGVYKDVKIDPYVHVDGWKRLPVKVLYQLKQAGSDFKNTPANLYLSFQIDLFQEKVGDRWQLLYNINADSSTHNRKPRMAPDNIKTVDEAQKWGRELAVKQLTALRTRLMKKAGA